VKNFLGPLAFIRLYRDGEKLLPFKLHGPIIISKRLAIKVINQKHNVTASQKYKWCIKTFEFCSLTFSEM
jgi:hypothetical protein